MSDERPDPRLTGRIGGLVAWSRNGADVMIAPAHRGFARRFERLVDPDGALPEPERHARAERAKRAWMLGLAAKSAAVRRNRKASPAVEEPGEATSEVRHGPARPTS